MSMIESYEFGKLDGTSVTAYRLRNSAGVSLGLCSYGARLTSLVVPDRHGSFADIVLGFNDLDSYVRSDAYHGATCGRFANRIRRGQIQIDGEDVRLAINDGPNHLHGGVAGFDRKVWASVVNESGSTVTFFQVSEDGEEGYPGRLHVSVSYSLNERNELLIEARATTDLPTIVSIINHTYWNLAGESAGSLDGHLLTIPAEEYLPVDHEVIPTGEISPVLGTRYDFRNEAKVTSRYLDTNDVSESEAYDHDVLGALGFDNTWRLSDDGQFQPALKMREGNSGRCVEVFTTAPSIQFYTTGYLQEEIPGKSGKPYKRYGAFTMEPQHEPDSPNHKAFSDSVLRPGRVYQNRTKYRFSTIR